MKNSIFIIFSVIVLQGCEGFKNPLGQTIKTTMKTEVALDRIEESVKSIGNSLEDNFNGVQHEAYINAINLFYQLKNTLGSDIDKYIEDLSQEQRNLFNNVKESIEALGDVVDGATEDLEKILNIAAQHLSHSPLLGSTEPVITRVLYNIILLSACTDKYAIIELRGKGLDNEKNELVYNSKTYQPIQRGNLSLKFKLPVDELGAGISENTIKNFKINTHYNKKKLLGLITKEYKKDFLYSLSLVFDNYASLTLEYESTTSKTSFRNGRFDPPSYKLKTGIFGGRERRTVPHMIKPIYASKGYSIVEGSVRIHEQAESNRCRNAATKTTIRQVTKDFIRLDQHLETESGPKVSCIYDIVVTWKESKNIETYKPKKVEIPVLSFCSPLVYKFPTDFKTFLNGELTLLNGQKLVFTNEETLKKYIEVNFDSRKKQLIVKGDIAKI